MLRIVLEWFALMLAPLLAYLTWTVWIKGTSRTPREAMAQAPLPLLFFAGLTLMILVMILARSHEESTAGKIYTPPEYKDGKIIPGQIK